MDAFGGAAPAKGPMGLMASALKRGTERTEDLSSMIGGVLQSGSGVRCVGACPDAARVLQRAAVAAAETEAVSPLPLVAVRAMSLASDMSLAVKTVESLQESAPEGWRVWVVESGQLARQLNSATHRGRILQTTLIAATNGTTVDGPIMMTPNILSMLGISLALLAALSAAVYCLASTQTPSRFESTPLAAGKRF